MAQLNGEGKGNGNGDGDGASRTFDARRDTMDFRDRMYVPTLIEVPTRVDLTAYLAFKVPLLDQGAEGACTGFGLATVANYLLLRREVEPDAVPVSPRMFYELARRYDEWPGEDYSGSSARGAMKGWNKHGVCAEADYPYRLSAKNKLGLNEARIAAAKRRPLGAYFRVNHKDLIAMHSAISEVGVLYATAAVHEGWKQVGADGEIVQQPGVIGGHAFAIVAYDNAGFWLQNSWGEGWGNGGMCHLSYDDWLENGSDVWVARLGAPVMLKRPLSFAVAHAAVSGQSNAYTYADLRPHLVSIGNEGKLKPGGDYGTTVREVMQIFEEDFPRLMQNVEKKKLLLYAHGGLVSEEAAVQRVAEYRPALLAAGVYPLAFIWHSDFWSTVTDVLQDAVRRRRPEGTLDAATDFLFDRLDDAVEPLARAGGGKMMWDEMKENALGASRPGGALRLVLDQLVKLQRTYPELEIHMVGHSAGAILHAPLVQLMTSERKRLRDGPMKGQAGYGMTLASCTLWAPACTTALFKAAYLPSVTAGQIGRFALFALSDKAEQDDQCACIYNKSLLYLVSNAFEEKERIPLFRDGEALLGMERFIEADPELKALFASGRADLVIAPNTDAEGAPGASQARHHGDFDDDQRTVMATFARIATATTPGRHQDLQESPLAPLAFQASRSMLRRRRQVIDERTGARP